MHRQSTDLVVKNALWRLGESALVCMSTDSSVPAGQTGSSLTIEDPANVARNSAQTISAGKARKRKKEKKKKKKKKKNQNMKKRSAELKGRLRGKRRQQRSLKSKLSRSYTEDAVLEQAGRRRRPKRKARWDTSNRMYTAHSMTNTAGFYTVESYTVYIQLQLYMYSNTGYSSRHSLGTEPLPYELLSSDGFRSVPIIGLHQRSGHFYAIRIFVSTPVTVSTARTPS